MCGLWAYVLRAGRLFDSSDYVRHDPWKHANANRGPDRIVEVQGADYHFCFHRLAIHDLSPDGDQPFYMEWENGTILHLMCNGEIYNYDHLIQKHKLEKKLQSKSDCEVICNLLEKYQGDVQQVAKELDGEFAFIARMEDPSGIVTCVAARDMFGVRPLYYGSTSKGVVFSSLLNGIVGMQDDIRAEHFPPGHTFTEIISGTEPPTIQAYTRLDVPMVDRPLFDIYKNITEAFISAVRKRLPSDRDIGFLLSGGLDSSLVVAVATKLLKVKNPKTFTIAFDDNATDLLYARKVADHVQADHTNVFISPTQALDTIPDVVKALETYDITTIRASTPQYLLAQHIYQNTNIRVILNGDGSDEVACGYLYHKACPSDEEASTDTYRLLREIHMFDGLRVDRTLGAHGLEARLPFLDPEFVKAYLSVPVKYRRAGVKGRMEKQLLRDAFASIYPGLLPDEVMYRKKEAFSDGVSSQKKSWYELIHGFVASKRTSEKAWYASMFDEYLPNQRHIIPYYWMPRWIPDATDPSARTLKVYDENKE